MYPLPIYLVDCPEKVRHDLGCVALNLGTAFAATFDSARSAIEALRAAPPNPLAPPVVLFPTQDQPALADLKLFRRAHPAVPVVALAPPDLLVAAMRAGASQVVTLPLQPDDCESALRTVAEGYAAAARNGKVVAVTGATGGAGATTLAINLAVELAELGPSVLLSEPTAPVGKLAVHLDVQPTYTVGDVLRRGQFDADLIAQATVPLGDRVRVLAADAATLPTGAPPAAAVFGLVEHFRGLADFAVLDLPCTFDDAFFGLLASADVAVLVAEQRIPSIRTLQLLLEFLQKVEHGSREVHVVVNRYDPGLTGFGADRLKQVLRVDDLDTVAMDARAVTAAVNAGRTLRAGGRSAALDDIARLARKLVPAPARPETGTGSKSSGLFARAFGFGRGGRP